MTRTSRRSRQREKRTDRIKHLPVSAWASSCWRSPRFTRPCRTSLAQRDGLQRTHDHAEDTAQEKDHPLVFLENGVQHALEAAGRQAREAVGERVPQCEGAVHVCLDLLRVVGQLVQGLPQDLVLDAFNGALPDKDGCHNLGAPQGLIDDRVDGAVHVPLEDPKDRLDGIWPPHHVLHHLPRGDEVLADHGGHLVGDLLLPLQEHTLDVDVATTDDVGLHRAKDHCDTQPVGEVADDQARHWQQDKAAPAPEAAAVGGGGAIELAAAVQQQPEDHLEDAEHKAHHGGDMLDEDKLPIPDVLEHLDQERLVVHEHVHGHLLDVDDAVDVGLQVLDDRTEHHLALLQGLRLQLDLHVLGKPLPELGEVPVCKPGQHRRTGLPQNCVQALEKVLWPDAV
eukprot:CAMPEP_0171270526 /NCGR_PEP_ID=MMETSP0790-20130122/60754_1 /TAXON_ID=2925 /ORGANISM="Alexandrium catenella, Strain OF101" /LENGTH=395 /DNA_ID=CAMNT_0011739365 /DNA_START=177 /DNA_END=1361 /DNA_ORIENTATION=+